MILRVNPMGTGSYSWSVADDLHGIVFAAGTGTTFLDVGTQALAAIRNSLTKSLNIDQVGTATVVPPLWS
jgi:hypothetical protein